MFHSFQKKTFNLLHPGDGHVGLGYRFSDVIPGDAQGYHAIMQQTPPQSDCLFETLNRTWFILELPMEQVSFGVKYSCAKELQVNDIRLQ